MDYQNVNSLNVWLNLLTGNLLPMINGNAPISFFWKVYSIFIWILEISVTILMIPGCMYVSMEKAVNDSLICLVETIEMFFMIWRIHARKHLMYELIQKLNEMLHTADKTMKNIVTETLDPIKIPFNFYWTTGMMSIIVWHFVTFLVIFEKNLFYYEDFRLPAGFFKQPFSLKVFLLAGVYILVSMTYSFIKKVGAEVYVVHLILMITAQYRYMAIKIAMIFQEGNEDDELEKEGFPAFDRKKEIEIRALCRHHHDVIQ
ncbi:PREDICTED: uncharacterized protein LOC108774574 [Cyphomyrmex costatus]|uniref:uncharacterized protein LOC108774574 n=1 Tax=Cyphomyrmex costatus TaxID=456900 RepID=UPI00085233FF|nr:PREDICTED: uncharacterized protein LOC108774574 [Cyphomyrmex costatus]